MIRIHRKSANEIHDGATEVRENLERDRSLGHAVYDEMRARRAFPVSAFSSCI
ncbi:hypothetical protein [Bradyrhizobium sp.]|uniref:hypothetical protein n=1 Tax=Bradyrhizobium sp. TaxID=376 RepID=UPI0039C8788D